MSFSQASKVWIYCSKKELGQIDMMSISKDIKDFLMTWSSHGKPVYAGFKIIANHFVAIIVDEEKSGISGCGIDKSVHLLKETGAKHGYDFFDRSLYVMDDDGGVMAVSTSEFDRLYQSGRLTDDTQVFDTMVKTLDQLDSSFVLPLKDSWHKRLI